MGVKSTVHLTRAEAEARYVSEYLRRREARARAKVALMSDDALEYKLEQWNDERVDAHTGTLGGGFDNYSIVPGLESD